MCVKFRKDLKFSNHTYAYEKHLTGIVIHTSGYILYILHGFVYISLVIYLIDFIVHVNQAIVCIIWKFLSAT